MDILEYAARRNINELNTCINTTIPGSFFQGCVTALTTSFNDGARWASNSALYSDYQKNGNTNDFWARPQCASLTWGRIPTMVGGTQCTAGTNPATATEYSGFKVCTANFAQGATCTWTVPANTTVARFQLWGAGGRAGSGCCCGGSTWGQNGAYASIIIPVVAGCQYTITAACGCRTPILWGSATTPGRSSPTSVTGFGLCNLCAMSGIDAAHNCFMVYDQGFSSWAGCCRWTAGDCFTGGACICNTQSDFCFANSCASCGCIPMSCSNTTRFFGCYTGSLRSDVIERTYGSQAAGIPGLNGGMCFDTNFYGIGRAAPVYGYNQLCSEFTITFTTGSTMGGLCCNHLGYDYRRFPGAGGTMVALYGGCTATTDPSGCFAPSCGGDIGRSGMVCVTFA